MKKIMIVDDELDISYTVKQILEKEGYEVSQAVNGDDCLKRIKKEKPDLIMLDIMMPGSPVRDVVPKITSSKILFFSVVHISDVEKKDLMSQKNVVGFIRKPFDINKMKAVIKKAIK